MNIKCSYTELVSAKKLKKHPKNPNKHSKEQIERLSKIINYQGQRSPVIVSNLSGFVVVGHGRLEAMQRLGWEKVAVDYQDFENEAQEYAHLTADNAIAEWAQLDLSQINMDILDLGPDLDLDMLGLKDFVVEPLDKLEGLTDEDEVPEVVHPITRRGDIWILGNHRLMCGDSTMIDDVEKLMNGEKADMVFTDPPYNVAIRGKFTGKIKNDNLSDDKFEELLGLVAVNIALFNKGSLYICYEIKNHTQFESHFSKCGEIDEIIIWNKDSASFYNKDKYNRKYEAILFIKGNGMLSCSAEINVWDYAKSSSFNSRDENNKRFNEKDNFLVAHPTTKPVMLIERALNNSSKKEDIILDVFGGSGSTLIASEKSFRFSRLMELDEKYCDIIIKRWEQYTGKKAILELTKQTYEELKQERLNG